MDEQELAAIDNVGVHWLQRIAVEQRRLHHNWHAMDQSKHLIPPCNHTAEVAGHPIRCKDAIRYSGATREVY